MTISRYIASGIAVVGLMCSSAAFAGEATRSASTLPTAKSLKRVAHLNRASKSVTDENHAIVAAALIGVIVAGAAVVAGIVVVVSDSNG